MDKNKVVKKLYILGTVANCFLLYQATEKYLKIKAINDHLDQNARQFTDRMNARKYHII